MKDTEVLLAQPQPATEKARPCDSWALLVSLVQRNNRHMNIASEKKRQKDSNIQPNSVMSQAGGTLSQSAKPQKMHSSIR